MIVCDSHEEMVRVADEMASEHVQVMTADPSYFLENMQNYGALFLEPKTNVAFGDKLIGTNHNLPTQKAARYPGGLWVGKFRWAYSRIVLSSANASSIASVSASSDFGSKSPFCAAPANSVASSQSP